MGKKIYFSYGSQQNIKITQKEDLEIFEGYVLEQQRKSQETVITETYDYPVLNDDNQPEEQQKEEK